MASNSPDPMTLVQETRPKSAMDLGRHEPGTLRRVRQTILQDHEGNERPVEELDGRNPAVYRSRIPPPPCGKCHSDHNPMQQARGGYDHEYVHPDLMEQTGGAIVLLNPQPSEEIPNSQGFERVVVTPATKRVSVFPGRGDDDFVLVVERRENDDWEDDSSFKFGASELAVLLSVLRSLDVKIKDRTGGDLVRVSQEHER